LRTTSEVMDKRNTAETDAHVQRAPLEFRVLRREFVSGLTEFFQAIASGPDHGSFHPHPMTREEAERICSYAGRDLYYAASSGAEVLAYGLLRGWDEGYEIPSLGIAVHPQARGRGLAWTFMEFLHTAAKFRGANKVRLTVYNDNQRAVELYRRLGYKFESKNDRELVGLLEL
jgi:ribosomal-protein-alanine N-acetyltransferase